MHVILGCILDFVGAILLLTEVVRHVFMSIQVF